MAQTARLRNMKEKLKARKDLEKLSTASIE